MSTVIAMAAERGDMRRITTVAAHAFRQDGHARRVGRIAFRLRASASALVVALGIAGCGDFHLSMSDLTISPLPARPGDMVVASFILNLLPLESHTIIVVIDSTEHMRVTRSDAISNPIVLDLGDAADLIEQYGAGQHAAHVRVHANESDEATRTRWTQFLLEDDTPQEARWH